jgi:hypothetical protein
MMALAKLRLEVLRSAHDLEAPLRDHLRM